MPIFMLYRSVVWVDWIVKGMKLGDSTIL